MSKFQKLLLAAGCLLILGGIGVASVVHYLADTERGTPMVYSNNALLYELWDNYKANNIEAGSNRTLDKSQNNITTSEGQSYTMLRAVWVDDKTTFDNSWEFTKFNLQRKDDHLMSWKFGELANGKYGIMTDVGGQNTASDADADIALALLMAYSRWNDPAYLFQAREIITSIWEKEVISVAGKPVLAANDIERNNQATIVVNPSYFSPASFRLFAKADPIHDWSGLANNSYDILEKLTVLPLDKKTSADLPPNWITMNRQTGAFIPVAAPNLDTNYGYDAIRIPFRLALDYDWYKDPRDKALLKRFSFLSKQWKETGSLKAVYSHDGKIVDNYDTPAMYGTAMGYFTVADPALAEQVYDQKLQSLYNPDTQQWRDPLAYYDDNWAWFGMALTNHALPNLAEINN